MTTAETRGFDLKAQLSTTDYFVGRGDKLKLLAGMADGDELMLGTVLGEARGLSYRHNPQDETKPSIAIVGPFKFIPNIPDANEVRSMRTFLPSAVHDNIVMALQGDNKPPVDKSPTRKEKPIDVQIGATMPIVLEVGIKRVASSATGYVYVTHGNKNVPLVMQDPLAALESAAGGGKPLALAAPPAVAKKKKK